jgi:hypothetical protein
MNAAPDRTAVMQQAKDERRKRLERAVNDVMEDGHGVHATAKNRDVPEDALRELLRERGWVAPRFRGRSRASSPS